MTDPYAPFPSTPPRPAPFPRERLTRAGLDEGTVGRLEAEYDALDGPGRVEFARYVTAHSDDAIRDRFAAGAATDTGKSAATPTYDELNAETIDELDDRLRDWNESHPDQHLTIAGRKGEKIGRLLDAYDGEQETVPQAPAPEPSEPPATPATGQLPTAPTATTPEGAPEAAPAVPVAPPGTVEAGEASTGVQEPAQTADATGAGPTT